MHSLIAWFGWALFIGIIATFGFSKLFKKQKKDRSQNTENMLSLRVELKTSRLLNGCSNQLSYESIFGWGMPNFLYNIIIYLHYFILLYFILLENKIGKRKWFYIYSYNTNLAKWAYYFDIFNISGACFSTVSGVCLEKDMNLKIMTYYIVNYAMPCVRSWKFIL